MSVALFATSLTIPIHSLLDPKRPVTKIALIGKYTGLSDSYLSVTKVRLGACSALDVHGLVVFKSRHRPSRVHADAVSCFLPCLLPVHLFLCIGNCLLKAVTHASIYLDCATRVLWVNAEDLEETMKEENESAYTSAWEKLKEAHAVLVCGGFGTRGTEGKVAACKHARETKTPFLGICLGMQMAVVEVARYASCGDGCRCDSYRAKNGLTSASPADCFGRALRKH